MFMHGKRHSLDVLAPALQSLILLALPINCTLLLPTLPLIQVSLYEVMPSMCVSDLVKILQEYARNS